MAHPYRNQGALHTAVFVDITGTLMPTVERLIHALWPWLLSKERAFYLSLYVYSKRLGANFAPERPECVSAFARGFGHGYVTNAIENNGSRLR